MSLIYKINKNKKIWTLCMAILLFVVMSSIVLCYRIGIFTSENHVDTKINIALSQSEYVNNDNVQHTSSTNLVSPLFNVNDDEGKWTVKTDIKLFQVSYENNESTITVESGNHQNVIAPGTSNNYIFWLKNDGDVALDYRLETYVTYSDNILANKIPLEVRLSDYNCFYLLGSDHKWMNIDLLNGFSQSAVLGSHSYASYTLDWMWLFESGNDEFDTLLGNLAVDDDLSLTITIKVIAEYDVNERATGGIPQTDDSSAVFIWVILMIGSLCVIFFHVSKKDDYHENYKR